MPNRIPKKKKIAKPSVQKPAALEAFDRIVSVKQATKDGIGRVRVTLAPADPVLERPTLRKLADNAALRLLTRYGVAEHNAQQAREIGTRDEAAEAESYALGDALSAIALERAVPESQRREVL